MKKDYPNWACWDCGTKHGANKKQDRISSWHYGECDVCKENKNVTEVRDYGHFPHWFKEKGTK
jgi:hypothetical protein